jgi:hypothetical protein
MKNNHEEVINHYKKVQESIGNDINDSNRFNPETEEEFYKGMLEKINEGFRWTDTIEINEKEKYIILDLLDDVGLYKITIEKLA